jgi:hypothetical protein
MRDEMLLRARIDTIQHQEFDIVREARQCLGLPFADGQVVDDKADSGMWQRNSSRMGLPLSPNSTLATIEARVRSRGRDADGS